MNEKKVIFSSSQSVQGQQSLAIKRHFAYSEITVSHHLVFWTRNGFLAYDQVFVC